MNSQILSTFLGIILRIIFRIPVTLHACRIILYTNSILLYLNFTIYCDFTWLFHFFFLTLQRNHNIM